MEILISYNIKVYYRVLGSKTRRDVGKTNVGKSSWK